MKKELLAIIPARAGSKRIKNKNIKDFLGKPLLAHTIAQALSCSFIDRVIVDTDSLRIAKVAKSYGAEVPWLRPTELARDDSPVISSILHTVKRLETEEKYIPTHILLLQTVTPLREMKDIVDCWELVKSTKATTVVTVFRPTNPRPDDFAWVRSNGWVLSGKIFKPKLGFDVLGYNGFVYIIERQALLKEKTIITKKTKIVLCPEWRSIDIDTLEDWALSELIYTYRDKLNTRLSFLKNYN